MKLFPAVLALVMCFGPARAAGADIDEEERGFIEETARDFGLDEAEVAAVLARARRQESILAAISRPAEAKPWHQYRPLFLDQARVRAGRAFAREHVAALAEVQRQTGVPAELIVAILGVETRYGSVLGRHRVLDALYTLGFHYPPRQAFFRRELAQLFALAREERLDPESLLGSYAGAMGWGQFMPSSYRAYARDGDGDGRRDLFGSLPDVFASVANYFTAHGWEPGRPVAVPALRWREDPEFTPAGLEPKYTLGELSAHGFEQLEVVCPSPETPATVLSLEGADGPEHWIVFRNFYVITRYNRSPLYAIAVHQLAQAIVADGPEGVPTP